MDRTLRATVQAHAERMIGRAQAAPDGLAAVARAARGDLLGPAWVASLAASFGPDPDGMVTATELGMRAQRIRSSAAVRDTGRSVGARLFLGSVEYIDRLQRQLYTDDQRKRAALYDRFTNPGIRITAEPTQDELAALAEIPLEGFRRDDALVSCAVRWQDAFRAAVVRALTERAPGLRQALRVLPLSVTRTFAQWQTEAGRVAVMASGQALGASMRAFLMGLMRPENRRPMKVA